MPYGLKGLFINSRSRWAVLRTKFLPASERELPSPWQILFAVVAVRTTAEVLRCFGQSCNGAWLEWYRRGRLQTPECQLGTQPGRLRGLLKLLRTDFFRIGERGHSVCQRDLRAERYVANIVQVCDGLQHFCSAWCSLPISHNVRDVLVKKLSKFDL